MSEEPGHYKANDLVYPPHKCGLCLSFFDFFPARDFTEEFGIARCSKCGAPYRVFIVESEPATPENRTPTTNKIYKWEKFWTTEESVMALAYLQKVKILKLHSHKAFAGETDKTLSLSTEMTKSGDTWDEVVRWREFKKAWIKDHE